MNEIKQTIIWLIELAENNTWHIYMDKTLSRWCIIFHWWKYREIFSIWNKFKVVNWIKEDWYIIEYIDNDNSWISIRSLHILKTDLKIIWHYDMTAILKYIEDQYETPETPHKIEISDMSFHLLRSKHINNQFPNKPLYLYTEKEETDLLNLLLKLNLNPID